jgi:hypothetical protein
MATRRIAGTIADATLPKTPITIAGREYNLCFDLGALAEAETAINAELVKAGRSDYVNLLFALPAQNLASTRIVFAAALRTFHPDIDFDAAKKMIALEDLYAVALKVREAWQAARVDDETAAAVPFAAMA